MPNPYGQSSLSARLEQVLRRMPDSGRAVAAMLVEGGFVGERNSLTACPVALYLKSRIGDVPGEVCVAMDGAWIYSMGPLIPLPESVRIFLNDFDKGAYPALAREVMPTESES